MMRTANGQLLPRQVTSKGRSSQGGGWARRSAASAERSAEVCSRQPCCGPSASARKRASRCQTAAAPPTLPVQFTPVNSHL